MQAQRLQKDYESAKKDLDWKIKALKESSELQKKLHEELRQARIDAQEDKLLEFEHFKSLCMARQEELEKLINSLKSFGSQSVPVARLLLRFQPALLYLW